MSITVEANKIEEKLAEIWKQLQKTGQLRACLFNLILFTPDSPRAEYIRKTAQKVLEKFPCRIIFISYIEEKEELETTVQVLPQDNSKDAVVCDLIDIKIGKKDLLRTSFLILPHLLPDLPIYFLWADKINVENPLFARLAKLSTRVIFDSECSKDFLGFAKTVVNLQQDIADLNWGRIEPWRNILTLNFSPSLYLHDLKSAEKITLISNSHQTPYFSHTKIQALYLINWLADRLCWQYVKGDSKNLIFKKEDNKEVHIFLEQKEEKNLKPATISAIKIEANQEKTFIYQRSKTNPNQVTCHCYSKTTCDVPTNFWIEKPHEGQSLVKEIYYKGTSTHYLSMLQKLAQLPKEVLC